MRKHPYIIAMLLLIVAFAAGLRVWGIGNYVDIIATILAIIAAVAFWMEFRSNERVNEAQLIMELNNQFISNEQLSSVERALEKYYMAYQEACKEGRETKDLKLDIDLSAGTATRQHLVNYLVHLEGIAALVDERVLRLKAITNLMAYRYFIAVNNPIVQKKELIPYRAYYQGCFAIYEKWSKTLGEDKVPMADIALVKNK